MVKFTISFLIGMHRDPNKSRSRSTSKSMLTDAHASENISFPSRHSRSRSSSAASRKSFPGFFINCQGASRYTFTINYTLIPGKPYGITIFIYKKMAKICTVNETASVRTIWTSNRNWFAFSVIHRIKTMSAKEILAFANNTVEFVIDESESKMPFLDRGNLYFCFENEDQLTPSFERVYLTSHNVVPEKDDEFENLRYNDFLSHKPAHDSFATFICAYPSDIHEKKILERIDPFENMKTSNTSLNMSRCKSVLSDNSIKSKIKKPPLTITGEQLLYDKKMWSLEDGPVTNKIKTFSIWITTDNLLPEKHRDYFTPIGISIKHLENIPLQDHTIDFSKVTLEYNLGGLIKNVQVVPKNFDKVKRKLDFLDYRMFLFNEIPIINIIRALQFEKLKIKIYAQLKKEIRDTQTLNQNDTLFTMKCLDERISQRNIFAPFKQYIPFKKPKTQSKILIGFATVDLSSLLRNNFRIDYDAPVSIWDTNKPYESEICDNALEIHNDPTIRIFETYFNESKYINEGTFLKVSIRYAGVELKPKIEKIREESEYYKRIIIKFNSNQQYANNLIERLIKLNNDNLPDPSAFYPGVPFYGINKDLIEDDVHPCVLTGFFIDNFDASLLVLEGFGKLTFDDAMLDVMLMPTSYGEVLHDSSLLFYERVYEDFIRIGGIYIITAKIQLNELFRKKSYKKKGNLPVRTLKALLQIEDLYNCSSMDFACRNQLFPTPQDLMSFEMEFGVPHYAIRDSHESKIN